MRDLKNVQPLADFDWDAIGKEHTAYATEEKENQKDRFA